jgi:hypothetical protein
VSRKRRGRARPHRRHDFGPAPAWYERGPADDEIATFEDDPDGVRLTIELELVVRVTRPKVLRRFAAETQAAMAGAIDPEGFGHLAYLAVTQEGLDEIAEGPAGQLRYLVRAGDVLSGIPGVAIEAESMSIAATRPEVIEALREELFGDALEGFDEGDSDTEQDEAAAAEEDEPLF